MFLGPPTVDIFIDRGGHQGPSLGYPRFTRVISNPIFEMDCDKTVSRHSFPKQTLLGQNFFGVADRDT